MNTKYVFVTGGVVSGLGKGITAASLGRLLKNRGYKVTIQKFDPYLNEEKSVNKYYQLEYLDTTYIKYRNKYNISGDRAEVCITQKLKSFKFPENDEKFMSEGYLWNEISKAGYKFRYFNKIIYISEYLNDGLSNNINDTLKNSPRNTAILKNQIVGIKEISILKRLKECVNGLR